MSRLCNVQSLIYEIGSDSTKDFDDIKICVSKESWKKFEDNLFKKAGYE